VPEINPLTDGTPEQQLRAAQERIADLERTVTSYAEQLRAKGIGHIRGGRTWRTKDQVEEGRREDGVRTKATTDQLGHVVTEHADGRQDVEINLP
jgi:hypothetical protein